MIDLEELFEARDQSPSRGADAIWFEACTTSVAPCRRRSRLTLAVAGVAVVAILVGVIAVIERSTGRQQSTGVADHGPTSGLATTALGLGPGPLELTWGEPMVGGPGPILEDAFGDGPFFGVATLPRTAPDLRSPSALLRLGDDGVWATVASEGDGLASG